MKGVIRSKMRRQKKFIPPVNFSKICVVLNTAEDFSLHCIAALPKKKDAEWTVLMRKQLEQARCKLPERFIAPYILLHYVTGKHSLGIDQIVNLVSVPKGVKVYADVMILYKKLASYKMPPVWSEVVPEALLPPRCPFSYHLIRDSNVLRYEGTIQNLYVMNEKILKQVDFTNSKDINELPAGVIQECLLTFEECEHILHDRKFSGKADGILKYLFELKKTRVIPGRGTVEPANAQKVEVDELVGSLLTNITEGLRPQVEEVLGNILEKTAYQLTAPSSHKAFPEVGFQHLKPIKKLLRIGEHGNPKWFRKREPIEADFINERVYRRTQRLNKLKTLVMGNYVSMLEGPSGAGKTVLALNLAYDLNQEGEDRIYYYRYDHKWAFDVAGLEREINSVKGIIILEDILTDSRSFWSLYSRVKSDPRRHILFTGWPSFRDDRHPRLLDQAEIPSLALELLEDVDEVIDLYTKCHPEPLWPPEVRQAIKDNSTTGFWEISLALKGYVKAGGRGDPRIWVAKGVEKDLEELDQIDHNFPEVLAAISYLYLGGIFNRSAGIRSGSFEYIV
jgi:hypothetical protein